MRLKIFPLIAASLFVLLTYDTGIAQPMPLLQPKPTRVQQDSRLSWKFDLSYNFGALTPVSLPANIRSINSWSPSFSPSLGAEACYSIKKNWSITAGLALDVKSMTVKDEVLYMHTIITTGDGQNFEGIFSGSNKTSVRNVYLSVPVNVQYGLSKSWSVHAGLYTAYLVSPYFKGNVSDGYIHKGSATGERVTIDHADFDFSKNQRKFDWGIHAGTTHNINKHWAATANLKWGLQPVFPASFTGVEFKMYNIFLNLGVQYRL